VILSSSPASREAPASPHGLPAIHGGSFLLRFLPDTRWSLSRRTNASNACKVLFTRPGPPSGPRVSAIARLEGAEGQAVLRRVLEAHPELRGEAEEIARALIGEVSFETIADDLAWELESREIEDLELRSARLGRGTVADAAWDLLQEALDPLVDDMRRRLDLGLEDEALDTCRGIILGLYRARRGVTAGCLARAPDFPEAAAENVLRLWRRECPRLLAARSFPPEFVARHAPEWKALFARARKTA